MKSVFCYSIPAQSVHNMFMGLIGGQLAESGCHFTCYNTSDYPAATGIAETRTYPACNTGYNTDIISDSTSYYSFTDKLLDTTLELLPSLLYEIRENKPDYIFHSHLAPWGKLLAKHFSIPAVNFLSTFVMHPAIMIPAFRERKTDVSRMLSNANAGRNLYKKIQYIHELLHIKEDIDIWDTCINEEALNVAMISEAFQPKRELLCRSSYIFCGMQCSSIKNADAPLKKDLIYISMGTVFNKNIELFIKLISAAVSVNISCIISAGKSAAAIADSLGVLPPGIKLESFVNQKEVLKQSACFITHGGMAGVQEAIQACTPMIVIPAITEQEIIAGIITTLGIGVKLKKEEITELSLAEALSTIIRTQDYYISNLRSLSKKHADDEKKATEIIHTYLNTVRL